MTALGLLSAVLCACAPRPEAASPPPPPMRVEPTTLPAPSPLPDPLPDVIATVNGRPIPLLHARIIADKEIEGRIPTPDQKASVYRRAMEQLIARELVYQEAMRRKIQPDAGAVERVLRQMRSEHKDEKAWKAFLAKQGMDSRSFVEELRVRNVTETMIRQEAEKVPAVIPEAEARAYYAGNPNLFESGGRPLPFEDVRDRITFQLVTFKRQEALNALLVRLRSAARVEKLI
jgi:SurA-like protein